MKLGTHLMTGGAGRAVLNIPFVVGGDWRHYSLLTSAHDLTDLASVP